MGEFDAEAKPPPGERTVTLEPPTRPTNRLVVYRRLILLVLAMTVPLGVGLLAWQAYERAVPQTATVVGTATVRSEFALINHRGEPVTNQTFRGRWQLVFFGFTYCPDICPTTLSTLATVLDELGEDAVRVAALFISVDPERDTPDILAQYVAAFHPDLIGLTGSPEQVKAAANAFKAYYTKRAVAGAPDGYLMDHAGQIYLMTPEGAYDSIYSDRRDSAQVIADAVRKRL